MKIVADLKAQLRELANKTTERSPIMLKPFFVNTSGKNKANCVRRAIHPRPDLY